jgi:hypothetical protein
MSSLSASDIAAALAAHSSDRTLAVGPCVYRPDKKGRKHWHFTVGAFEDHDFHATQIFGGERERSAILDSLRTRSLVVHSFDDEGCMANWCAVTWPCERTRCIASQANAAA